MTQDITPKLRHQKRVRRMTDRVATALLSNPALLPELDTPTLAAMMVKIAEAIVDELDMHYPDESED